MSARLVSVARWSLTVNLALTATVLLAGDVILSLLGDDTVLAAGALVILCLGMLVYSVFAANEQLLIMSGRQYLGLLDTILWVVLSAALNWWLIPDRGLPGAAIASIVALAVGFGVMNLLPLGPTWAKATAVVAFMPVYLGGLYLLGLDQEDRLLLGRAAQRLRLRPMAGSESG